MTATPTVRDADRPTPTVPTTTVPTPTVPTPRRPTVPTATVPTTDRPDTDRPDDSVRGQTPTGRRSPSRVRTSLVKIEAEDFNTGGEGVAYHDVEPQNLGNSNYRAGEGVDIETRERRDERRLHPRRRVPSTSVDTTAAGAFTLVLHAANPDDDERRSSRSSSTGPRPARSDRRAPARPPTRTSLRDPDHHPRRPVRLVRSTGHPDQPRLAQHRCRHDPDHDHAGDTTITPQTTPYGPGNNIPGRVQAENFDKSGAGAATRPTPTRPSRTRAARTAPPSRSTSSTPRASSPTTSAGSAPAST